MTDPTLQQGASEGTPVPASTTLPEVTVTTPLATQSYDIKMPDGSTQAFTPEPGGPADTAAPTSTKVQPTLATPPAPGVPSEAPKRAVDLMPPAMPDRSPVRVSNASWEPELEASAASAGVDVNVMRKLAGTESNFNPNARARTSSAVGIFQITGPTWDSLVQRYPQLNLTDQLDPKQQARVAPYYMREINENLQRKLGRPPNAAEMKLGWVFGPTGGALIMGASPDTPVGKVVDRKAIEANPGIFKTVRTVGELYAWAGDKMGEQGAHPKPAIDLTPYLAPGHDISHLDKMDWDLKSRLASMVNDMPENLRAKFQINSGFRSPERQKELFDAAVKKYGSEEAARKWVAPPGNSMHNHGKAADLAYSDEAGRGFRFEAGRHSEAKPATVPI